MKNKIVLAIAIVALASAPVFAEGRSTGSNSDEAAATSNGADLLVLGGGSVELAFTRGSESGTSVTTESYLELENKGFYVGVYGTASDQTTDNEVDLYLGYRTALASGIGYDLGYRRYTYPNDGGNCCGQITFGLTAPVGERLTLGMNLAYDPQNSVANAFVSAEYALSDVWTVSGIYGTYEQADLSSSKEWEFGITRDITDSVGLDVRYNGAEGEDPNIGLSLVFDSTLFSR